MYLSSVKECQPIQIPVGDLPLEWNWLVSEYEYNDKAKNVHYTEGGPWFEEYKGVDYSKDWYDHYNETTKVNL